RELHSLKSAARAVNIVPIESICQRLESAFADWKLKEEKPNVNQFDLLHKAVNIVEQIINDNNAMTDDELKALLQEIDSIVLIKNDISLAKKELEKTFAQQIILRKNVQLSGKEQNENILAQMKILEFLNQNEAFYKGVSQNIELLTNKLEQNLHNFSVGVDNL